MKKFFNVSMLISASTLFCYNTQAQSPNAHMMDISGQNLLIPTQGYEIKSGSAKPTAVKSKLVSFHVMLHNGAEFKRNGDSSYIFSRENQSLEKQIEDLLLFGWDYLFTTPSFPDIPINTFNADSIFQYKVNAAASAFDEPDIKTIYTLNSAGNVASFYEQKMTGSTWLNTNRTTYTFNSSNEIIEQLNETYPGAWTNDYKYITDYYPSGETKSYTTLKWTAGAWANSNKKIYEYDAAGNCTSRISQIGSGTSWLNTQRITLSYNANSSVTEYIRASWDGITNWDPQEKRLYAYSGNNLLSLLSQIRVGNTWEDDYRRTNTYTGSTLASSLIEISTGSNSWKNSYLYEYAYISDYIESIIKKEWIPGSSTWKSLTKMNIPRNAYHQATSIYIENWNAGGFWESILNSTKYVFFYEEYDDATNIKSLVKELDLSIYPNPAKDILNIFIQWKIPQEAMLSIYDISGRKWLTKTIQKAYTQQEKIETTHLPSGIYYLMINTNVGQITKEFQIIK